MTKTVTLLDPTVKPKRKEINMAARPDSLEGRVAGFLWNSKPNGEVMLDRLSRRLNEKYHFSQIVRQDKPQASHPASEDVLDELAAKCDVVLISLGD